ncbi:hypothetical protein J0H58_13740 [bacterium]|nr:hypothetical protein [bacterium]
MITLPPALARHFRAAAGQTDFRALVRTPDARLVELARGLTPDERAWLYHRLGTLRVGFVESLAATAAGFDVEHERRRLMRLLEVADEAELAAV